MTLLALLIAGNLAIIAGTFALVAFATD